MEYEKGDFVPAGSVSAGDVMIDGNAIGDVGNIVLRDRRVLSEDGIFIVAITVNRKEKKIISKRACTPVVLSMSRRVGIFFVKVANWSTKALKTIWHKTALTGVS